VLARLREIFYQEEVVQIPSLKSRQRANVNREVKLVNGLMHNVVVNTIDQVNKLLYAGSFVVAERLGLMRKRGKREDKEDPWWKRRIEGNIVKWRKDLSRIEELRRGRYEFGRKEKARMDSEYGLTERGTLSVREFLKAKIHSGSTKIRRFLEKGIQFHQNNLFKNNQSQLYKELGGADADRKNLAPDAREARRFWGGIWSEPGRHVKEAEWLRRVKRWLAGVDKQEDVRVTTEDVAAGVRRMSNWKAPGPDGVRGFWFKKFSCLHQAMAKGLQGCLDEGNVPEWMVKGRTVLIQKDPAKGTVAGNYRPIACLPLMWKLLTGIFAEGIYDHLKDNNLLPDEQKGCRKQSRGTKDQLLIDKAILKEAKRKRRRLAMAWVDYKKAYDMVPHSWLVEVTAMMGVAGNVRGLLERSMGSWKTELTAGGESLGTVDIKRGIFQGDSLSPLLFVMVMIPLSMILKRDESDKGIKLGNADRRVNHLLFMDDLKLYASDEDELESLVNVVDGYSRDIGMEFGMDKCAVLTMEKGKRVKREGMALPSGEVMKEVDESGYKYLGVLQTEEVMDKEMKRKIKDEYLRRVRLLARSRLYAGNLVQGINAWAVGVVRYSAGILDWTKEELKGMDIRTRKVLAMNGVFHRHGSVGRLYMKRKEGGRGLISVEDCVRLEEKGLWEYVNGSEEWMLKEVVGMPFVLREQVESRDEYRKRVEAERKESLNEKVLHGRFFREIKEIADERSWQWVSGGYMAKSTERYIFAAQEQALGTRWARKTRFGEDIDPMCRVCGKWMETVSHLASGCGELAKKQYVRRHDRMGVRVHWELCKKYGIGCTERWYEHVPNRVSTDKEGQVVIYWDVKVETAKALPHNRPDVVVVDKRIGKWTLVDFSVPLDKNVVSKEDEKVEKYLPLAQEIRKMHKVHTEIIPIVIGALGTVPKRLTRYLKALGIPDVIGSMQMTVLLGTTRILKNVLSL
jgi:hypothetical protein